MKKQALDYAGDAFIGETPEALERTQPEHDWNPTDTYNWFYGNGQLHVSEDHEIEDLASHAGVGPEHTGPIAMGTVHVDMGRALWDVQSNIHAQAIARILKEYTKEQGWQWGGLTDLDGEPIGTGSEFAPKKSFGGDNVIKNIEDLEINNTYSPEWSNEEDHPSFESPPDERLPGGVFKCPECARIFPSWGLYIMHRRQEDPEGDTLDDGKFPELDPDATFEPHQTFPTEDRTSAAEQSPKDMIQGSVPFLYDIDSDKLIAGSPGSRSADLQIPGKFTPGGIVEGTYEPGGKVIIQSMTNTPYSVRHLLELWYYSYPQMEITGVELMDSEGQTTKLARNRFISHDGDFARISADDPSTTVRTTLAADPTAWKTYQALTQAGGHVYVVGGAVRDAVLGKTPKDVDLMVTGLPGDTVNDVLKTLKGNVNLTGKDFGVYRYRDDHGEVEVALPRRDKSTSDGHKGFDVQTDHNMAPEEDLYRRDFTANALAFDTQTGHIIDPFGGVDDIHSRNLRTLNTKSLGDDPLRTVRALAANSQHGLNPDEDTKQQMENNAAGIQQLPSERIRPELDKIFGGDNPAGALRLAHETGVLKYILPDVDRAMGHNQNNPHHEQDLGSHLLSVLERVSEQTKDPDERLAAVLHDIGKVDSHWTECRDCGYQMNGHQDQCPMCGSMNTSGHFYKLNNQIGQNHETLGAEQARKWMTNMTYPNERINRIAGDNGIIANHMYSPFTTPKGARKFMNKVGPHADALMRLRWADQGGKSEYPTGSNFNLDSERALVQQAQQEQAPTNRSQLAITGADLIKAGIPAGPMMGQILNALVEKVLDDPALNSPQQLISLAQGMANG